MQVEWYGQSAFRLTDGDVTVVIDPFGNLAPLLAHGRRWDYPPMAVRADLLLVTHEHLDHNGVEVVAGEPVTLRSSAGTFAETPVGEVVGIASEHDDVAGTLRGPNTLFAFSLGGLRIAHLGDLGQRALRPEQLAALGHVDLLIAPVGGGPTIGAAQAWARRGSSGWPKRPSTSRRCPSASSRWRWCRRRRNAVPARIAPSDRLHDSLPLRRLSA